MRRTGAPGRAERRAARRPWLSVLMPVYDGERYLPAALASVAEQPGSDAIEVIAVDDGSTDRTAEILRSFSGRLHLRIVERAHKGNWVENTNHALGLARAPWSCILHQDDVWLPGRLERLSSLIARFPGASLFLNPSWYIDPDGERVGTWSCTFPLEDVPMAPEQALEPLLVQNAVAMPAPVFRRDAARRVGGLDADLWYTADWDFWMKLAATGPTVYTSACLTGFRIHDASQTATRTERLEEMQRQTDLVLQRHLARWDAPEALKAEVAQVGGFSARLNTALAGILHGQGGRARALLGLAAVLGSSGSWRYLRDSRILERLGARVRVKLRARSRRARRTARPGPEGDRAPDQGAGRRGSGEALDSRDGAYADRLERLGSVWWKAWLDVQRPYRRNLERLALGRTLDVGCGIGRNLATLPPGSVGVDPNAAAVARARARGCVAYEPDTFADAPEAVLGGFDSLLVAHVLEHLSPDEARELLERWLPYVRPGGRVVLITPQEAGHACDPTHVTFQDFAALERLTLACDLRPERHYSFPFPRPAGRVFLYNEFVSVVRVREEPRPGDPARRAPAARG